MRAYHFVSSQHALEDIRYRRLKIARLDELNDPFELWAIAQPEPSLRQALRRTKENLAYSTASFASACPGTIPCFGAITATGIAVLLSVLKWRTQY
jgi:hypothetical protein